MEQWAAGFFVGRQPRFARRSRDHDRRSLFWLHGGRGFELRRRDCVVPVPVAASLCEASASPIERRLQLLERKFDSFFFLASYEFVSLNDAGASVPPKNRIVVPWRAERF